MGKKKCLQCNKEFESNLKGRVYIDIQNGLSKGIRRFWFCCKDHFIIWIKNKLKDGK